MNRRALLASVPLAILAGCQSLPDTSTIATDVALIASGLTSVLAQLPAMPNATLAQLQAYLADIKTLATQIAANATAPLVQSIVADVQDFAAIATPLIPAAAPYAPVIQAALALLPGLLTSIGLAGAVSSTSAPKMTPAQARAVLAAS